jgi:Family of unknown function (DUF6893)
MNDIRITPAAQLALLLALLGAVVAVVLPQLPEIQRYLKVRQM